MTIFGKIILGILLLSVAGGIFYSVTSTAEKDIALQEMVVASSTTQEIEIATTTASSTFSEVASTTEKGSSEKKMPFSEFMKQGGSHKCTVTQTVASMTTKGVVYIDGQKIKADFAVAVAGQSINTMMIIRDGYTYTWTSNDPTRGYKTKVATGEGDTAIGPKGTYTWDGSQIGEYSCNPWTADASLFEIPKTVTFVTQ